MTKDERLAIAPACAKFDIWFFSGASKLYVILEDTEQNRKYPAEYLGISMLKVRGTSLWKFEG
jgi:hypothetical protein